jgi:hypothetical protein
MRDFFAEYWLWILVPSLVVAAGIVLLVIAGGSDDLTPFKYNVF